MSFFSNFSSIFHSSGCNKIMSSFTRAKQANQRNKDIVNGFIKQCQNLFDKNNIYHYNIPSLISNLCIDYFWISEYFTLHGSDITLNKDKNIVTLIGYKANTIYGNVDIDNIKNQ